MNINKKILTLNKRHKPMIQAHFYKWLGQGNYSGHRIADKAQYLQDLGFTIGKDKINEKAFKALSAIYEHYFHINLLPTMAVNNEAGI